MKIYRKVFVLVSLLLAGCPVTQINRVPVTAPLAKPGPITQTGEYIHSPSGYRFPNAVAGFSRDEVVTYDSEGLNIGVGYNGGSDACKVVLTIHVYPAPRMSFVGADPAVVKSLEEQWLSSAYSRAKQEIQNAHPGAELQSEDAKVQDSAPGKKAVFAINNAESLLYVFLIDRTWFLKYRVSYPKDCEPAARESLDSFFKNWQGRDS